MPRAKELHFLNLGAGKAELRIYDRIGAGFFDEGITAQSLHDQLKTFGDVGEIDVYINSPGGSVFDGIGIYNLLLEHPAQVTVHVDGIAASIASVIAMAADPGRLFMADTAVMMIHDPMTIAVGNAKDMRDTANTLDTVKSAISVAYEKRTGLPAADISEMMSAETFMNAQDARAKGFADAITEPEPAAVEAASRFDLSAYRNAAKAFPMLASARIPQRQESEPMPATNAAAQPAEIESARREGAEQARNAEKNRRSEIRATFGVHAEAHRDLLNECLEDCDITAAAASSKLLAKLGEGISPAATPEARARVEQNGADERDKFVAGMSQAISARYNIEKVDPQNEFNGMRLGSMIRASLKRAGGDAARGVDRLEGAALASRFFAMSTSDFPLILANTANKALRKAYDTQATTWQLWCDVGTVSDFKSNSRLQIGTFNSLTTIPEGGQYTYGDLAETGETIQAATKGRGLALTRQLIINDDLGVFVKRASIVGFAAKRTVNEDVYTYLTQASGVGPNLSDGGALFNATAATATGSGHQNYTSSGTALSDASIGVGEKTMRLQKDKSVRTQLNIAPRFLLVPAALKQTAWALLNNAVLTSQANPGVRSYTSSLNLELVVDALLDGTSSTAWYLIADPNSVPLVEVAFLDGVQTPYTDEAVDWDTDALKMKVRLDYGVGAIDFRAGYRNAGA